MIIAYHHIEKRRFIAGISHFMGWNLFNVSSQWNGDWFMLEKGKHLVELTLAGFAMQFGICSVEVSLRGEELKDIFDLARSHLQHSETTPDIEVFGINGRLRPECSWRVERVEDADSTTV